MVSAASAAFSHAVFTSTAWVMVPRKLYLKPRNSPAISTGNVTHQHTAADELEHLGGFYKGADDAEQACHEDDERHEDMRLALDGRGGGQEETGQHEGGGVAGAAHGQAAAGKERGDECAHCGGHDAVDAVQPGHGGKGHALRQPYQRHIRGGFQIAPGLAQGIPLQRVPRRQRVYHPLRQKMTHAFPAPPRSVCQNSHLPPILTPNTRFRKRKALFWCYNRQIVETC